LVAIYTKLKKFAQKIFTLPISKETGGVPYIEGVGGLKPKMDSKFVEISNIYVDGYALLTLGS
jgi:hypothetical protein